MRPSAELDEAGAAGHIAEPTAPMPVADAFSSAMVALEHSPAALGLATLAGDLLYLNANAERLFGIAPGASLAERNLADICTEPGQLGTLEAVARDGRERNLHIHRKSPDVPPIRLLWKLTRVAGYGGIPTWLTFAGVERDDKSMDDDHASLGEAESMSIIRRLTSLATWKMPLEERERWTQNTMRWDDGFHPLLNLKPGNSKIAMRNFLDFIAREDRERAREALEKALVSGSRFEAVYRVNPRNGPARIVLSRAAVGVDEETSSVPTVFGVVQDITSALGHEVHPYEKAAILDTIAASMEAPVYAVDRDLRYTYFNSFFAQMMRRLYETEAVLGEKVYEAVLDDGRRRTVLGHLRRALSGARVVEELAIPLDDAIVRYYELTYSPIKSDATTAGVTVFGTRSPGVATAK